MEELRTGECDVTTLAEKLNLPPTRLSQHLSLLRTARMSRNGAMAVSISIAWPSRRLPAGSPTGSPLSKPVPLRPWPEICARCVNSGPDQTTP
ncbi:ArsR family transcriptional regulator [Blastomonas sp. CCH5-A3]|uniref:ArsR family transcriptional regulator n=1 Tax=Blastomonas sp. CCH5-A3 TaxID=1768761 RepID=UPI001E5093D9|nr:ArsR family transcriptional regulator [Blastomonas sp. CCH5-A3]